MILTSVRLQSFRSYLKRTFAFHPSVTLIIGKNATGKTNIIEAISMISTGKSFRAETDREVIHMGSELARIIGNGGDDALELVMTTGEVAGRKARSKKYIVNGVPRRGIDFIGTLHSVLFWPEDLELVTDSPSLRRRYLDRVLTQADREYRRNLSSYERGLRQRNSLLGRIQEGTASRGQLLFWNQLLIKTGNYITDARDAYISYINAFRLEGCDYQIVYDTSVISEIRLEQYSDAEIAAGVTLVGPHRDDFMFMKRFGHEYVSLSAYGSRGEQRLGVLWLKRAELSFIMEKTGDRPILLLDDIFSELDEGHRNLVLEIIKDQQTVITSAEDDIIPLLVQANVEHTVIQLTEL